MKRLLTLLAATLLALPALAQTAPTELYFSEYIEGSSNNKALEIYNPTGAPVVLTDAYSVQMYFNGSSAAGLTINLTGTIAPGDVFVLAQSSASADIRAQADQTNGSGWFNGDDAVVLRNGTTIVDAVGQIGSDPGSQWGTGLLSTADNTLRRKVNVCTGDTNTGDAFDPSAAFDGFATDDFEGLGAHTADCGGDFNNAPVFTDSPADGTEIPARSSYSFQYAATDADGDALTFSLVSGPAGASITPGGLFTWTPSSSDVGESFTVQVAVTDGDATATSRATLAVISDNLAPAFTTTLRDTLVGQGTTLSVTYAAADADGDAVTLSLVSGPDGAAFDAATGRFTWTATGVDVHPVTVSATDGESVVTTTAVVGVQGVLFPGQTGSALRASLRGAYTPARTLGYDVARDTLYALIDLRADGLLEDVYAGFAIALNPDADPSTDAFNQGINAEHTWPQSMGAEDEPGRSDMHNLFPSKDNVNSARSNKPYGEIPDGQTTTWYRLDGQQSTIPTSNIDEYSENAAGVFEPREIHKGNAARAALYFYTIYEALSDRGFLLEQKEALVDWNGLDDADGRELRRTAHIAQYQQNINPLILDSTLATRIVSDILPPEPVSIAAARADDNGVLVTVEGVVTRAQGRFVRIQDATAGLTLFQSSGRLVAAVAAGNVAMGDVLRVTGTLTEFNGLRQMTPTLFEVRSRNSPQPEAQTVTLAEIAANGEAYESELIRVLRLRVDAAGDAVFAANKSYDVTDPTGTTSVLLRVPVATDGSLDGQPTTALPVYFEGVLSQFQAQYQLQPVLATDLVRDTQAPVIRIDAGPMVLASRNHKLTTTALGTLPLTVDDGFFGAIAPENAVITKITSDEAAFSKGSGKKDADIVTGADCRAVELRAERDGGGNGRVYTLFLAVADESGNVGTATYAVHVPHDNSGRPVIDDGPAYEVATGCTAQPAAFASETAEASLSGLKAATASLPSEFALEQNFPNPFSAATAIVVALPEAADVMVKVYNLLGQEVARLAEGHLDAGHHEFTLDGTRLAAGMYVYTLEAGDFRATRRMVLVK